MQIEVRTLGTRLRSGLPVWHNNWYENIISVYLGPKNIINFSNILTQKYQTYPDLSECPPLGNKCCKWVNFLKVWKCNVANLGNFILLNFLVWISKDYAVEKRSYKNCNSQNTYTKNSQKINFCSKWIQVQHQLLNLHNDLIRRFINYLYASKPGSPIELNLLLWKPITLKIGHGINIWWCFKEEYLSGTPCYIVMQRKNGMQRIMCHWNTTIKMVEKSYLKVRKASLQLGSNFNLVGTTLSFLKVFFICCKKNQK